MKIILNNTEEHFKGDTLTIAEILKLKNFVFKMLVIKVNNILIKKTEYDNTIVKDGDDLMILHLVSGG
ncbi:MAG: sulfur carrier protein ThiS [Bacteroidota bacterium]